MLLIKYELLQSTLLTLGKSENLVNLICGNKMLTRRNRWFLLHTLLLAQHVSGTLCPSSGAREYDTGDCCLWYLVLWFSSFWYGVERKVMCPVCGLQPAKRTHNARSKSHQI